MLSFSSNAVGSSKNYLVLCNSDVPWQNQTKKRNLTQLHGMTNGIQTEHWLIRSPGSYMHVIIHAPKFYINTYKYLSTQQLGDWSLRPLISSTSSTMWICQGDRRRKDGKGINDDQCWMLLLAGFTNFTFDILQWQILCSQYTSRILQPVNEVQSSEHDDNKDTSFISFAVNLL